MWRIRWTRCGSSFAERGIRHDAARLSKVLAVYSDGGVLKVNPSAAMSQPQGVES